MIQDWRWIDGLVMDWQICQGLELDWSRTGGLAEWTNMVAGLASRSSLAETSRIPIVLVPSGLCEMSVRVDPRLARIGIGLADW